MDSLPPDPYKILGVDRRANRAEIRSAYRKLILKCHPDKFQDPALKCQKQKEFDEVQAAWELLNDENKLEKDSLSVLGRKEREERNDSRVDHRVREKANEIRRKEGNEREKHREIEEREKRREIKEQEKRREVKEQEKRREREERKERDERKEKEDFIEFALKLFVEAKRAGETPHVDVQTQQQKKDVSGGPKDEVPFDGVASGSTPSVDKPAKSEKLFAVPARQLNLEQMNPWFEDAQVDLIAVHGLGAIPDITWKEKKSGTNWLSDKRMLPAAVPKARILRFGYDSLWMGDTPIRTTLSTIAIKLLLCLSVARAEELDRPLIFIGHCFGGLVIERALILAKMHPTKYPSLFDSCIGVVFLGTPHRGSASFTQESALLSAIATSSDLYQNLETEVLETMTSKTGSLLDVSDDFITLCVNGGPKVSCFFEQRSSKLGKVIGRKDIEEFIVDCKSATFDGHPKYGLEVDHFSLNKFDGPTNPNYVQIRAVIVELYQEALRCQKQPPPRMDRSVSSPRGPRRREAERTEQFSYPTLSTTPTEDKGEAEEIRKEAIRELREDEARKSAALHDMEYQKRLAEEKLAIEQAYCERLKKNMVKYGVPDPDAILDEHPLPKDQELKSELEFHDKERWHQSILKEILVSRGLDGGQIDEVLNDTGETMAVDGVETAFTRMAAKWVSTRTLDGYGIPWQYDKNDPSAIIITRWVPKYEQEFIWDHTYARRTGRERKRDDTSDPAKGAKSDAKNSNNNEYREEQGKAWLLRNWEKFKASQQQPKEAASGSKEYRSRQRSAERSSAYHQQPKSREAAPPTMPVTKTFHRSASYEAMRRSAPDQEVVSKQRRESKTMRSASQERLLAANSSSQPQMVRSASHDGLARKYYYPPPSDSDDDDHRRRHRRSQPRRYSGENSPPCKVIKVEVPTKYSRASSPGPYTVKYAREGPYGNVYA